MIRTVKKLNRIAHLQKLQGDNKPSCRAWVANIDLRWHIGGNGNEEDSWREAQGIRPQGHGKEVREQVYLHVARSMGQGGSSQGNDCQGQMDWGFGR